MFCCVQDFNAFLGTLPHRYKIVIGGNHDQVLLDLGVTRVRSILTHAIYLQNDLAELPFP